MTVNRPETYVIAFSNRSVSATSRQARRSPNAGKFTDRPLLHASPVPPRRYSRTGKTYVAVCGAQVAIVLDGSPFRPYDERACGKCAKEFRP